MRQPFVLGLTGGIAMGKSTTAKMFEAQGAPVFDADACVHELYANDHELQRQLEAAFPGSVQDHRVDRMELSRQLQTSPDKFKALNEIVHPVVQSAREKWRQAEGRDHDIVVFDIPLLFETGAQQQLDAVVVVHAPKSMQVKRAMARPGMTREKLYHILARQMSARQKRKLADYVIRTDEGMESARLQVAAVLRHIRQTRINRNSSCAR